MSKEELNVCLKCFDTSARKKDGTYYKSSSTKIHKSRHWSFSSLAATQQTVFHNLWPRFHWGNKVLEAFVKENGKKNSWRRSQKSNLERAGEETIWERRTRPSRQFESCPVTEDGLVLPRPLFWKMGTWKPATVDTRNAFSTKNSTRGWILLTNWTEVSLVPCRLQKITREASQMLRMNRMRRYFPSRDLKDVRWKHSRPTWVISIKRQMLCFRDREMVKKRSSIPQSTKFGFAVHLLVQLRSTTWWKRCQSEQV